MIEQADVTPWRLATGQQLCLAFLFFMRVAGSCKALPCVFCWEVLYFACLQAFAGRRHAVHTAVHGV